jgi:hypothetical protein
MIFLEQAESIMSQITGTTDVRQVSGAISSLTDLTISQREVVSERHRTVNAARADEDDAKITLRKIESMLDQAKRLRQELRDDRYSQGL